MKPLDKFLNSLRTSGLLTQDDVAVLKAHAGLSDRAGTAVQIANAATVSQAPRSWHYIDCLYRWLGHALATELPSRKVMIGSRPDGTTRWWMALAEEAGAASTLGTVNRIKLRDDIAAAVEALS